MMIGAESFFISDMKFLEPIAKKFRIMEYMAEQ